MRRLDGEWLDRLAGTLEGLQKAAIPEGDRPPLERIAADQERYWVEAYLAAIQGGAATGTPAGSYPAVNWAELTAAVHARRLTDALAAVDWDRLRRDTSRALAREALRTYCASAVDTATRAGTPCRIVLPDPRRWRLVPADLPRNVRPHVELPPVPPAPPELPLPGALASPAPPAPGAIAPPPEPPRPPVSGGLAAPAEGPGIRLSLNLTNPESLHYIAAQSGELVQGITAETQAALKELLHFAFAGEPAPQPYQTQNQIRELLRASIGLDVRRERWAQKMGGELQDLAARGPGALTDRQWERLRRAGARATSRARLERDGLRPGEADRLTLSYREKLLRERAQCIGRTEAMRASNEGTMELWRQAQAAGNLPPHFLKEWMTHPGCCPKCAPLHGQRRLLEVPFETPWGPVNCPPGHPNCRCSLLSIRET